MRFHEIITERFAAYHGTPYDVDAFSLKHVGTGEGAQAYGWGLYFAGNEDVAAQYASRLSDYEERIDVTAIRFDGKTISAKVPETQLKPIERAALQVWYAGSQRDAIRELEDWLARTDPSLPVHEFETQTLQAMKDTDFSGRIEPARGQIYEIEIGADEEDFLRWDDRFSEQPAKVQAALIKLLGGDEVFWRAPTGELIDLPEEPEERRVTLRTLEKIGGKPTTKTEQLREVDPTGKYVYQAVMNAFAKKENSDRTALARSASMFLYKNGVPGIKYLDGFSRRKGHGSYNYVVFNGNIAKIKSTL